jgi:ankyrin repeat protein
MKRDGWNPDVLGAIAATLPMFAALRGNQPLVRLLLERGADPKPQNRRGETAISFAEKKGCTEIARLLRQAAGANP